MAKDLEVVCLIDVYGRLLTPKQLDYLGLYYEEDLSLAEIAANEGVSRQAVRDAIKRAESQMLEYERHMKLIAKQSEREKNLNEILSSVKAINQLGYVGEIGKQSSRIEKLVNNLLLSN